MEVRCSRIVARLAGWKMCGSSRRVMRRVLEGGVGVERGGIFCRSIERGEWARRLERVVGEEEVLIGGVPWVFSWVGVWGGFEGEVWMGETESDIVMEC